MAIEKMRVLAHESVYWVKINTDIENTVKQCATCMAYQQTQPCEKIIPYEMPQKSWDVISVDIFTVNTILCTVDYYSKFPIIKKTDGLPAESLIKVVKIVIAEFGLPKNIVSEEGKNFISEKFRQFCRQLDIEQPMATSRSMHKIVKHAIKIYHDNNDDVNLALLQIRSTPIGTGLPSPATLLFNTLIRALLPQMNRDKINFNNDDEHYEVLKTCQEKYIKGNYTCKDTCSFPLGLQYLSSM